MSIRRGALASAKGLTADGFESRFGTNHPGRFVFVNRIAALLQPGSRLLQDHHARGGEVGGRYCEDCRVAKHSEGNDMRIVVRAYALDPDRAEALWAKSGEMAGEGF